MSASNHYQTITAKYPWVVYQSLSPLDREALELVVLCDLIKCSEQPSGEIEFNARAKLLREQQWFRTDFLRCWETDSFQDLELNDLLTSILPPETQTLTAAGDVQKYWDIGSNRRYGVQNSSQSGGDIFNIYDSKLIDVGVFKLKQIFYSENHDAKIPEWLSSLEYSDTHNELSNKRTPGTGTWFLRSAEFKSWLHNPYLRVLWCPGIPGAGKSIIVSLVIDHLRKRNRDTAVNYIYFTYKLHGKQNLTSSIQTLCRQLHEICRITETPSGFEELYISHLKHKSRPSLDELLNTLRFSVTHFKHVYVILDALDEYLEYYSDDQIQQLIKTVLTLSNSIKIMVTSRILGQMENIFERENAVRKEIIADPKDLEAFLNAGIAALTHFKISTHLSTEVVHKVKEAAKGRFLMAELHMGALARQLTPGDLKETLSSLPREIDKTYALAMQRIDASGDTLKALAMKTLMWVYCTRRPMTIGELQHALAIKSGRTDITEFLTMSSTITSACAGLVVVENEKVGFVHFTTREFFNAHEALHFPLADQEIAHACLDYLLLPCFRTLASSYLSGSRKLNSLYEDYPFYDYAALNWGFHINTSVPNERLLERTLKMLQQIDESLELSLMYTLYSMGWDDVGVEGIEIFLALYHRQEYALLSLIDKSRIPATKKGLSTYMFAAYLGLTDFIELMVERWNAPTTHAGHLEMTPTTNHPPPFVDRDVDDSFLAPGHLASADLFGNTPISYAAWGGRTTVAKLLLQYTATKPDQPNNHGITPLFMAAFHGHEDIVKLLVEHRKRDVYLVERLADPALAPLSDDYAININVQDKDSGNSPLMLAAQRGHTSTVEVLLKCEEIDVNAQSFSGFTALILAAEGEHTAVVELLLKCPALNVNLQDSFGSTALRVVAEQGLDSLAISLLKHRYIDINIADRFQVSPFMSACARGHTSIAKLLLEHQTPRDTEHPLTSTLDLHARNVSGWSALTFAARHGSMEAVKLLLRHTDIDSDSRCNAGCTPLSIASEFGHADIVQLLLDEASVDINNVDNDGDTALICAAYNGLTSVVEILLRQPAIQVNVRDKRGGRTALSRACDKPRTPAVDGTKTEIEAYPVIALLLDHTDIDINLADDAGNTPLYYASQSGFTTVIKLLQDKGGIMHRGTTP